MPKNVPLFIAKRYFFSKNKKKFINILTLLAVFGVAIGTLALIVAPAVINGLGLKIREIYDVFDSDYQITVIKGKMFDSASEIPLIKIKKVDGVESISLLLEEYALLSHKDKQLVVSVKGIDSTYHKVNNFSTAIVEGTNLLKSKAMSHDMIVGKGLALYMDMGLNRPNRTAKLYYPKDIKAGVVDKRKLFRTIFVYPTGTFFTQNVDARDIIFVPLAGLQQLMNLGKNVVSSLEIKVSAYADKAEVYQKLKQLVGNDFQIKNKDEQHTSLMRALKTEKMVLFIVFTLILAVSSFNILFSLTLLAIEKKNDNGILRVMGLSPRSLAKIYLYEGVMIASLGSFIGLVLGISLIGFQKSTGFFTMGQYHEPYPVLLEVFDVGLALFFVIIVTFLASFRPAILSMKMSHTHR